MLHCKYIDCQKYNFLWCNVSHALPVPFGHFITVPSTADKWYVQLFSIGVIWNTFMVMWMLKLLINGPHLIGREDEAAGSCQNNTRQPGRKKCVQTYIKVIYSGFSLYEYIWRPYRRISLVQQWPNPREVWDHPATSHVLWSSGHRVTWHSTQWVHKGCQIFSENTTVIKIILLQEEYIMELMVNLC